MIIRTKPLALFTALAAIATTACLAAIPLPKEKIGVTNIETAAIALPKTFDMTKGRTLRMRKVTIEPGGALPMHSHIDRPSAAYVLEGTLTEVPEGETEGHQIASETSYATFAKGHALLNQGRKKAVFLEVDIPEAAP